MKVILEFNLPEEAEEYKTTMKAGSYYSALWDLQEYILRKYKHIDPTSEEAYAEYRATRERFLEIMEDYEVRM